MADAANEEYDRGIQLLCSKFAPTQRELVLQTLDALGADSWEDLQNLTGQPASTLLLELERKGVDLGFAKVVLLLSKIKEVVNG